MTDTKTEAAFADAAPKSRRTWSRKPKAEDDGHIDSGAVKKRRTRKSPKGGVSVFGAQSAAFDLMVLRAGIARIMRTHLEAMSEEFGRLAAGNQDVCARLIAAMAAVGMKALQEMELNTGPDSARVNNAP